MPFKINTKCFCCFKNMMLLLDLLEIVSQLLFIKRNSLYCKMQIFYNKTLFICYYFTIKKIDVIINVFKNK